MKASRLLHLMMWHIIFYTFPNFRNVRFNEVWIGMKLFMDHLFTGKNSEVGSIFGKQRNRPVLYYSNFFLSSISCDNSLYLIADCEK